MFRGVRDVEVNIQLTHNSDYTCYTVVITSKEPLDSGMLAEAPRKYCEADVEEVEDFN